jgi:hypothetical protein
MRRPAVQILISQKRYDDLPEQCKGYYNTVVFTNNTVKKPYFCPKGRSHCSMCSRFERSGRCRRLARKKDTIQCMHELCSESLSDDELYSESLSDDESSD